MIHDSDWTRIAILCGPGIAVGLIVAYVYFVGLIR
jgi:hypothetical protein